MRATLKTLFLCAGVAMAGSTWATVVDFETKSAFSCDFSPVATDNGMQWNIGFASCFYSPANPADFPTAPPSTVMANGYFDTEWTKVGGGTFDLSSVDLAFGPFDHLGLQSDITVVTGYFSGGGTIVERLEVDYSFSTYQLNWSNLEKVVFSKLVGGSEYLAFDNLVVDENRVPEPLSIALVGAALLGLRATRRPRAAAARA
jgi:hypothetical protein